MRVVRQGGTGDRPTPVPAAGDGSKNQFRKLTPTEFADKRAKGLCFRCDGKFGPGHRCPDKSLKVLMVADDELVSDEEDEVEGLEEHAHLDHIEVSAHSVAGLTAPQTMKLRGVIGGITAVVLIDSGATHNFLSLRLVGPLGLRVTGRMGTGVVLGYGKTEKSMGLCRGVEMSLQGIRVTEDFYTLEMGGTDVILGMVWLRKLGEMRVNWRELSMTFEFGGERVTLRGEPGLRRGESSLHALAKRISTITESYCLVLTSLTSTDPPKFETPADLRELLDEYADVFDAPVGLPPSRDHEHRITLKGGTEPISVRPYRYPQVQKDEIERLVSEMLEAGIIRPSTSPFSSPVLLVKKKDGSWRFCVDYRALNRATVLDKFPIPVIDELLDE